MAAERTSVTCAEAPGGVRLAVHSRDGMVVHEVTLSARQALLLAANLINEAVRPTFRLIPEDQPAGTDAGQREEM